jgi:CTP:molybdopterin cytidylyltransferase MocA/HD superfamily phosphohydrolase YqeK
MAPVSHNFAAIVLAAGASSRMGRLKPLLPLGGRTALECSITLFRDAGIDDILAVVGNHAEDLRPLIERCGARCIYNAQWETGMYSSVVAGASALRSSTRAAFVLPADVPLVRSATVRQLAAVSDASLETIVYPVFEHRRGHPPLIARRILDEAARGASGSLRVLLLAHEHSAIEVPVPDEAIHLDMDTPADFDTLEGLAARRDIPTTAECEAMLAQLRVPEPVGRHSRKVAQVACRIVDALQASHMAIDPNLVRAAALLHDMAKGQPRHAEVAAAILQNHAMYRVAEVVTAHTEMAFDGTIDERAVVYLADKLVSGDRLISLEERFRRSLDGFRDNSDALASAHRRKAAAEQIAVAIENCLGIPLMAVLNEAAPWSIPALQEVTA